MPSRDNPYGDGFPDMSIPDRNDQQSEHVQSVFRPVRTPWRVGDRVLAPWEPDCLYAGKIVQIQGDQAHIEFDDGDAGMVRVERIQALAVQRGQKVTSRKRMGPVFHPGEVREVRGDQALVVFDQGGEEWTTVAALRVPCAPTGPGAAPTRVASHQHFFNNLRAGDRVWAPWNAGMLYAGTVHEVGDGEIHVHLDDGNQGWVQLQQIMPLEIPPGLRVLGRWKMGAQVYPGTVTEVKDGRVHIQYDDGDREWTKPAALAVMCQPFGPPARATKTATRFNAHFGWLIPVAIGIGLLFLRAGCR